MPVHKGKRGVEEVMREFSEGSLHSGSSEGRPKVKDRKQAIAIALKQSGMSYYKKGDRK